LLLFSLNFETIITFFTNLITAGGESSGESGTKSGGSDLYIALTPVYVLLIIIYTKIFSSND